ncbi:putative NAD(P)/FAD-binding protein YdhS [Azospirillum baldaniorum]|uniref:FAD/NAD(P)-binding protein n=1 Tax=Azospirillum baldaniorum TaxID=1064539 RepID=UPI0011A5F358|nr:FAD/NAD(P)-binding protein [Azospirillum baldaniorum]TWA67438.1 putative NAD(P)/FAD-binding protein YdhS [Azospirillum baldaniorum]
MSARPSKRRIAIIGAGFTGSVLAAHLMRRADEPTSLHLIERTPSVGAGLAYSTPNAAHLLNVRAYNMSAYPDDPRHFLRWLWAQDGGVLDDKAGAVPPSGHAFVSRARYGAYIQDVLREAMAAAPRHVSLTVSQAEAVDIASDARGTRLRLGNGTSLSVDTAVLCVGNFAPSPPPVPAPEVYASSRYVASPWDWPALATIAPDAPVLILGTGLTMVDTVLSLEDQGHRGPIVALSRRGLLPQTHEETRPFKSFIHPQVMPRTVLDVMIALKADVRRARETGFDWRSAFDALRPYHHLIWSHLPTEERRRFLRHVRPYWEVHRHRIAPEVAARIAALRANGRLTIRAGRLQTLSLVPNGVEATVRARGAEGTVWTRTVGAIVNATGTECDFSRIAHPLVKALLTRGLARPDPLRLGLDVTVDGALIGEDGQASDRLFALGPVSRPPFWEMTAVPELRNQCAQAARHIAGLRRSTYPLAEPAFLGARAVP